MTQNIIISSQEWLDRFAALRGKNELTLLQHAISSYQQDTTNLLQVGLGMADLLLDMGLDQDTIICGLYIPAIKSKLISLETLSDVIGENRHSLLSHVMQMKELEKLQNTTLQRGQHQVEKLRKLLLAIVTDVRVVIIVLVERLCLLRHAKEWSVEDQQTLAQETLSLYAPLANRLGVWQLKWEIEDFCLRYLQPDVYKQIAKGIAAKREEREKYITYFKQLLIEQLDQAEIKSYEVTGRVKHIYSIYKKMQRKNTDIDQIYDRYAFRVLTHSIPECYAVLGVLQSTWSQVQAEFDDYIAHPKVNGYQSIHIVLIGPENHFVEVQIRTIEMHQASELGVASHWAYKEGILNTDSYEAKIVLLRQLMAWQKEVTFNNDLPIEQTSIDIFTDRVYVFTPTGDIIDLPQGATPVDFAYHIHSEVGHRCRGAKINGAIVPLTYVLKTGEHVEILTAKHSQPSRDWLNPHSGYVKATKTRSKIAQWFRSRDVVKPVTESQLEKNKIKTVKLKEHFNVTETQRELPLNVTMMGIDNLLSHVAQCCKPLPGDEVIGYITRARGVSIHRFDCGNVKQIQLIHPERLLDIVWGEKKSQEYETDIVIKALDRPLLLRDITSLLANEKINILEMKTQKIAAHATEVCIVVTIHIGSRTQLIRALAEIKSIPQVLTVSRN